MTSFPKDLAGSARLTGSRLGMRLRAIDRGGARLVGRLQGRATRGWAPVVLWMMAVILALEFLPLLLQRLLDALGELELWSSLGAEDTPELGHWFSLPVLIAVFLTGLILRGLVRARERVVVEEFVDYTQADAQAVRGMAPLLVAELSGLSQLYRDVNEQLSVPLAVGVERRGGFGRGKEPGSFLTVQAHEVTDLLSGAVASEAKIEAGPFLIPIGAVLAVFGRLVRGPRVLGSVHRTAVGGGPTLTVQMVGRGPVLTWRVDHPAATTSAGPRPYVPDMVAEMAVRIFTDLNLEGSARWQAIQAFTEYLRLYQRSQRTPRDRARFLKQAEAKLVEAVAKDDSFDLAFYNLGVIYSQLAQQELTAAQSSDVISWRADVRPEEIRDARIAAAALAFRRALERNRGRWQAYYALAVHHFASMKPLERGQVAEEGSAEEQELNEIVRLCERVLELRPRTARAEDLLGMALVRLGEFHAGIAHHRRALRRYWRDLCRTERREAARPAPTPATLERARANAAAALHNLGLAHTSRGLRRATLRKRVDASSRGRRLSCRPRVAACVSFHRADLHFRQALKLAPAQSAAASHFERGHALEGRRKFRKAAASYRRASASQPENPEYWAALARAVERECRASGAGDARTAEATKALLGAFDNLTPVFARSVERFPPRTVTDSCEATLQALRQAFAIRGEERRADQLEALRQRLAGHLDPPRPRQSKAMARAAIRDLAGREFDSSDPDAAWKRDQIDLALAHLYGRAGLWEDAECTITKVIDRFSEQERALTIAQLGLQVRLAQAQRRRARTAPERARTKDLHRALRTAEGALRADPLSAAGRREAGRIHFELNQFEEAIGAWTQALSLIPNDPLLYLKLGICHWQVAVLTRDRQRRVASLGEAAECLTESLLLCGGEYERGKAWALLWLGRTFLERNEIDDALAHLRSAAVFEATRRPAQVLIAEATLATDEQEAIGLLNGVFAELEKLERRGQAPRNGDSQEFAGDLALGTLQTRVVDALARTTGQTNGRRPGRRSQRTRAA